MGRAGGRRTLAHAQARDTGAREALGRAAAGGMGARGRCSTQAGRAGRAAADGMGTRGRCSTQEGRAGHAGARARALQQVRGARGTQAWVRPGRAVGPVGCALGLFLTRFDSVLFLSRFLDIVREPGS